MHPVIIAHRGASGYLPEHTLEAKALAFAMGADFIEQDVVASRDDELLVLHDIQIDRISNVAGLYPDRARGDGRYYARDFDLAELRTLNIHERRTEGGLTAVYPERFPTSEGSFRVATLAEEIQLVQGLNASTGRRVGIYPEIKRPAWHHAEGVDLSHLVLEELYRFGYGGAESPVFLQCFDAAELRRIRHDLQCQLPLVQLIGENSWEESETDYESLKHESGLAGIATTVDAIGPWVEQLYTRTGGDSPPESTGMVEAAHAAGLKVHPFTFRKDDLATGFETLPAMLTWFARVLGVDGVFTDFPDIARSVFRKADAS